MYLNNQLFFQLKQGQCYIVAEISRTQGAALK